MKSLKISSRNFIIICNYVEFVICHFQNFINFVKIHLSEHIFSMHFYNGDTKNN